MPIINRQGAVSHAERPSPDSGKSSSSASGGYDIGQLVSEAERMGDKSNDYKYQIAVEIARSRMGDDADADDDAFKSEIDSIYENELNATNTGRDQRGENPLTDAIGGVGDFFNGAADIGGDVLDWAFDNTVGNVFEFVTGDDYMKDLFDGDDAAIVADSLMDMGLSAIPGVGIGLATMKNAAQMYPTIQEAVYGIDNVTGEDLTLNQRLGAIGSTALGLGMSMIPGWGGARVSDVASDALRGAAKSGAKEAAGEVAESAVKGAVKDAAESGAKKAASSDGFREAVGRLVGSGSDSLGTVGKRIADNAASVGARHPFVSLASRDGLGGKANAAIGNVLNAVGRIPGYTGSVIDGIVPNYAPRSVMKSALTSDATATNLVKEGVSRVPTMLKNTVGNAAGTIGGATLGTMAQTGEDLPDAYGIALSQIAGNPLAAASALTGLGTRRASRTLRAPNGGISPVNYNLMANRFVSANRDAYHDPDLASLDYVDTTGMTNDELVDWMRFAREDYDE